MQQSRKRRLQVNKYDQINLTNMIDLLFFLLIIFMITAPLLESSVNVKPPEMNAEPINPDPDSKIINVLADGSIVFDRRTVTEAELQVALSRVEQQSGRDTAIFLRGDRSLRYDAVMNVMKLIRASGFRNVNLVMLEEPK